MLSRREVVEKNVDFNLTQNNYNGGFIAYWKLLPNMIKVFKKMYDLMNVMSENKWLIFYRRTELVISSVFAGLYALLIKPFGCVFSTNTAYSGKLRGVFYNGQLNKVTFSKFNKRKIFKFVGVPFFCYWAKSPSVEDNKILTDKFLK